MSYGHSTRAVSSPIASGQLGRMSVPKRFLPLSQFFLQQDKPIDGEKVIYGRPELPKKKTSKDTKKPPASTDDPAAAQEQAIFARVYCDGVSLETAMVEAGLRKGPWDKPHKCKYCEAPATRDLIWADGRAYIPVCDGHRKRGEHRILVKNSDKIAASKVVVQAQEGITTTVNVPTVAVPIGAGDGRKFLDGPGKKKKKPKKDLPVRMSLLLRQLF